MKLIEKPTIFWCEEKIKYLEQQFSFPKPVLFTSFGVLKRRESLLSEWDLMTSSKNIELTHYSFLVERVH